MLNRPVAGSTKDTPSCVGLGLFPKCSMAGNIEQCVATVCRCNHLWRVLGPRPYDSCGRAAQSGMPRSGVPIVRPSAVRARHSHAGGPCELAPNNRSPSMRKRSLDSYLFLFPTGCSSMLRLAFFAGA